MTTALVRNRVKAGKGFSLLELVLVLGILMALAAVGIPRYGASAARYRADLVAQRLVADLRLARGHAKATSASQSVEFDVSLNQYTLPNLDPLDPHLANYTVKPSEQPYRAVLTAAVFGNDDVVIFDGWGVPDSGGSVTLQCGSEQRTVVLDGLTGEAKVQ
ncbi:MAG: hypothetical protein IIC50_02920 [Planctomycetes bacterium]|nr:hypothetical protein [Planctomycetota bacterium]